MDNLTVVANMDIACGRLRISWISDVASVEMTGQYGLWPMWSSPIVFNEVSLSGLGIFIVSAKEIVHLSLLGDWFVSKQLKRVDEFS